MNVFKNLTSKKIVAKKIIDKEIKNGTIMEVIFKSILFSGFLVLLVFMFFMSYYIYQLNIKHSVSMIEEETKSISTEIDHFFEDILTIIDILSYSPELNEANQVGKLKTTFLNVLSKIEDNSQIINRIFVCYEDNTLLINDSIFPENYNLKEAQWYNKAIQKQVRSYSVENIPTPEKDYEPKFIISKSFSIDGGNSVSLLLIVSLIISITYLLQNPCSNLK